MHNQLLDNKNNNHSFKHTTNDTVSDNKIASKVNFNINTHNINTDGHTWRPMKLDSSGDIKPEHSILLHQNGKPPNITLSDSWIPNSGPITQTRD